MFTTMLRVASAAAIPLAAMLLSAGSAGAAPAKTIDLLNVREAIKATGYTGLEPIRVTRKDCFQFPDLYSCWATFYYTSFNTEYDGDKYPDGHGPMFPADIAVNTYPSASAAKAGFLKTLKEYRKNKVVEIRGTSATQFTAASWLGEPVETTSQRVQTFILRGKTVTIGTCAEAWKDRDEATADQCATRLAQAQVARNK
ncbi:MAG: hypothetical protein QG671_2282 [Actinomycetota bacterium]|nr:hypothetical protein [Actinomycetota bacterium]